MKRKLLLSFTFLATFTSAHALTFVIGDGFALDGTGSFGTDPFDNPSSTTNSSGRDDSITDAEISYLYNTTQSSFGSSPYGGGIGFDPFIVGEISFNTDIFRSGSEFDLSGLPAADPGFEFQVTNIELFIEVSGATFTNGLNNDADNNGQVDNPGPFNNSLNGQGDLVTININTYNENLTDVIDDNTLPTADTSFTIAATQTNLNSQFHPAISINPNTLDLNEDNIFGIVLSADVTNPTTAGIFGSSLPSGVGITGTNSVAVAPVLRITAEQVAIPEPSAAILSTLASLGLFLRRRQTSN